MCYVFFVDEQLPYKVHRLIVSWAIEKIDISKGYFNWKIEINRIWSIAFHGRVWSQVGLIGCGNLASYENIRLLEVKITVINYWQSIMKWMWRTRLFYLYFIDDGKLLVTLWLMNLCAWNTIVLPGATMLNDDKLLRISLQFNFDGIQITLALDKLSFFSGDVKESYSMTSVSEAICAGVNVYAMFVSDITL